MRIIVAALAVLVSTSASAQLRFEYGKPCDPQYADMPWMLLEHDRVIIDGVGCHFPGGLTRTSAHQYSADAASCQWEPEEGHIWESTVEHVRLNWLDGDRIQIWIGEKVLGQIGYFCAVDFPSDYGDEAPQQAAEATQEFRSYPGATMKGLIDRFRPKAEN